MDRDIKIVVYLFICLSAVFFMLSNGFPGVDGEFNAAVCKSIFKGSGFGIVESTGFVDMHREDGRLIKGKDGKYYSMFGLGGILALVPFYAIGVLSSKVFTFIEFERIISFVMAMLQVITISGTASLLYIFARKLNSSVRASIFLTILYAFATTAFVYSKGEGIDYLNGFFILGSFYWLYQYKLYGNSKSLLLSGFSIGFAISLKIIDILIPPVSILYLLFILKVGSKDIRKSLTKVLLFLIWPVIFLLVMSWYNTFRFGAFYLTGYHTLSIITYTLAPYPIYKGLYGFFLSPGRSVFLYNPPLIFSLFGFTRFRKRFNLESNLILLATMPSLFIISGMLGWEGGYAWGPRYLAPFIPLWLLFSLPLIERSFNSRVLSGVVIAIFITGFLVQLPAVMMNYNFSYDLVRSMQFYQKSPISVWHDIAFKPSLSPLITTYKLTIACARNLFTHATEYININHIHVPLTKAHITPSPWIFQIYKLGYGTKVKMLAISMNLIALAVAAFSFFKLYKYCRKISEAALTNPGS